MGGDQGDRPARSGRSEPGGSSPLQSSGLQHDQPPARIDAEQGEPSAGPSRTRSDNHTRNEEHADDGSHPSLPRRRSTRSSRIDRRRSIPEHFYNLDEVALPNPVENPDERPIYRHRSLEEQRPRARRTSHGTSSDASQSERSGVPGGPSHPSNRRRSIPEYYYNLDEVAIPNPVENPDERSVYCHRSLEDKHPRGRRTSHDKSAEESIPYESRARRKPSHPSVDRRRSVPDHFYNLDEVALPSPVENPDERRICRHHSLEERLSSEDRTRRATTTDASSPERKDAEKGADKGAEKEAPNPQGIFASRAITELCTISHLIFFSILGTLARLGLEALTNYPGAPVVFTSLWVNFAGSLFFGFLAESSDRVNATRIEDRYADQGEGSSGNSSRTARDEEERVGQAEDNQVEEEEDLPPQRQPSLLYVGLSTGFCGSFTTFSSFMRDVFLALSNNMSSPPPSRSIGDDFMAPLAILIGTLFLCVAAIRAGAHIAILVGKVNWVLPGSMHFLLNRAMLVIGILVWAGAIVMAAVPPDRPAGPASRGTWGDETWRGLVLFALVFAPVGCIARFYLSSKLNGLQAGFPIGTFAANIIGTMILGMAWDLHHSSAGSARVSCQVLQGMMDGFCGCLTTVSTWVAELGSLRRRHAYVYGGVSLGVSLASLVIIMGSHLWSTGWTQPTCPVV